MLHIPWEVWNHDQQSSDQTTRGKWDRSTKRSVRNNNRQTG